VIPNDVSAGLLSLAVDFAETPGVPDQTITMGDLAQRFNASSNAIGCDRDPVIYSDGTLSNSGTQCVTLVSANNEAIKAKLTLADIVQGDVKTTPKIAAFANKNISLKLTDPNWDKLLGGDIQTAARIKGTDISTKTSNASSNGCFRLRPVVAEEKHLDDIIGALTADPTLVNKAVDDIRTLRSSIASLPTDTINTDEGFPQLMALTGRLDQLIATAPASSAQTFQQKSYNLTINGKSVTLRPTDFVTALDMYVCSSNLGKIGFRDYDKYFPRLNIREDISAEKMNSRSKLAGKMILCTFASDLLSDSMKTTLKDGVARLNSP
jgi:hypothetical protein